MQPFFQEGGVEGVFHQRNLPSFHSAPTQVYTAVHKNNSKFPSYRATDLSSPVLEEEREERVGRKKKGAVISSSTGTLVVSAILVASLVWYIYSQKEKRKKREDDPLFQHF